MAFELRDERGNHHGKGGFVDGGRDVEGGELGNEGT